MPTTTPRPARRLPTLPGAASSHVPAGPGHARLRKPAPQPPADAGGITWRRPGGATADPQSALAASPSYLAFLRALGAEESDTAASTQTRVDQLNRDLARHLPFVTEDAARSREAISGDFEARGLFRSGQHETTLARQRADEAREVSYLQGTVADQVAALQGELARKRAELARRRSEASLDAARSVYVDQVI